MEEISIKRTNNTTSNLKRNQNLKRKQEGQKKLKKQFRNMTLNPKQVLKTMFAPTIRGKGIKKLNKLNSYKGYAKQAAAYQHSYARSIVVPEFARGSKLPSVFPQPTTSIHKHITIPFTASASGKAAIIWNPFFLSDTTNARSYLAINNSATLTLTSVEATTGYAIQSTIFGIPINTMQSYRLVSASITITPEMSLQTAQGTIGGGIANYNNQNNNGFANGGANWFAFAGDLTIAANVDNLLYFNKANVTALESIRHIYFPFDPSFEDYQPMNLAHNNDSGTDFFFAYYVTGAPAAANFNIELYMNYECIPHPVVQAYLPMDTYEGGENSNTIIKSLSKQEVLLSQVDSNIPKVLNELDQYERQGNYTTQKSDRDGIPQLDKESESGWLNRSVSFIGDHIGDISSIIGMII
jgi:hypothetical protein